MIKSIARTITIALLSSQLACLPVLADSGLLTDISSSWIPTLNSNQIVYVDPALENNLNSPILFGRQLESEIAKISLDFDIRFYVIIKETKLPSKQPISNAEIDRIFARWNGLPEFNSKNYAMIVWSRSAENPAKGNIAINLNKHLSQIDTAKITKKYMPADPKGAILAIAEKIISEKQFNRDIAVTVLVFILLLSTIGLVKLLIKFIDPHFIHKKEADEIVKKWYNSVQNHDQNYLKISEYDEIISWLKLQAEDSEFGQNLGDAITEYDVLVLHYSNLLTEAKDILVKISEFRDQKLYKNIIAYEKTLHTNNIKSQRHYSERVFLIPYILDRSFTLILAFYNKIDCIRNSDDPSQLYREKYSYSTKVLPHRSTHVNNPPIISEITEIAIGSSSSDYNSSSSDYNSSSSDYNSSSSDYNSSSSDYNSSSSDYNSSSSDYGSSSSDYGSSSSDYGNSSSDYGSSSSDYGNSSSDYGSSSSDY